MLGIGIITILALPFSFTMGYIVKEFLPYIYSYIYHRPLELSFEQIIGIYSGITIFSYVMVIVLVSMYMNQQKMKFK